MLRKYNNYPKGDHNNYLLINIWGNKRKGKISNKNYGKTLNYNKELKNGS
jgi:hypothetical protein